MTSPLVSVVIASYNQAKYLGYTIESVLHQTYSNIELIVVDDGSTDHTKEVLSRYDGRLKSIWQPNSERGAARNRGLCEAMGEFIAFLDADDLWMPEKLAREVNVLIEHPNIGVVYSDVLVINGAGSVTGRVRKPSRFGWVTRELLISNFVSFSANLMRRAAAIRAGGFPEDRLISGSEDWVFWVKVSTLTQFAHLNDVNCMYRVHPENTSSNATAMERAMRHAAAEVEHAPWLPAEVRGALPAMRANRSLANAINFCSATDRKASVRYLIIAAKHAPSIAFDPRFTYTLFRNTFPGWSSLVRRFWRRWKAFAAKPLGRPSQARGFWR